jgi:hypothetical protein
MFFAHFLQGKSCYTCELKTTNQVVGPKPLLKKLLLQMHNCVNDSKNRSLLTLMLLLTTREMFEKVKLGFFVVGHIHEDIDGCFWYLPPKSCEIKTNTF